MPADGGIHGPATIVRGHANAAICNADRMWLQSYIYAKGSAPDPGYVPPQFAKMIKKVPLHWEMTKEIIHETGLRAQLWEPRDRGKDHVAVCEPTLIYRGSMPVFTDIAVYFKVEAFGGYYDFIIVPQAKGSNVAQGGEEQIYGVTEAGPIYGNSPVTDGKNEGYSVFGSGTNASEVRDRLKAGGWECSTLTDQKRDVEVNLLPQQLFGTEVPRTTSLSIHIVSEIWTGPNGDWANNFRQGWGLRSPLYKAAIEWSRTQVQSILTRYNPPRIFFTGHSLGGGLAGAMAERMAYEFRAEKRLHIRGMTFNAAGVHPKTVNFWPSGREEPAGLGTAPVIDHTVVDEILTTLQSRPNDMPLIGHILRMAGKSLPPAVTAIGYRPGLSPGKQYSRLGVPFGPVGSNHPRLFPVRKDAQSWQTAVPRTEWPNLLRLQAVMATSQTPLEFAQNLIDDIWATYHKDTIAQAGSFYTIYGIYKTMFTRYFNALKPELDDVKTLMLWSTAFHSIQTVEQTYIGQV